MCISEPPVSKVRSQHTWTPEERLAPSKPILSGYHFHEPTETLHHEVSNTIAGLVTVLVAGEDRWMDRAIVDRLAALYASCNRMSISRGDRTCDDLILCY